MIRTFRNYRFISERDWESVTCLKKLQFFVNLLWHKMSWPYLETIESDKIRRQERLEELLAELDISGLRNQRAESLSGGQKRRLEITRALVTKPNFMLLDEPFAGLDPIVVLEIQKIIFKLKQSGIGIVITDHNTREILGVCDTVYLLDKGHILEEGSPEMIAGSELAKAVYLGNKFSM